MSFPLLISTLTTIVRAIEEHNTIQPGDGSSTFLNPVGPSQETVQIPSAGALPPCSEEDTPTQASPSQVVSMDHYQLYKSPLEKSRGEPEGLLPQAMDIDEHEKEQWDDDEAGLLEDTEECIYTGNAVKLEGIMRKNRRIFSTETMARFWLLSATTGFTDVAEVLWSTGLVEVDVMERKSGRTALQLAVCNGHDAMVGLLLAKCGASWMKISRADGYAAVHFAVERNDTRTLSSLLKHHPPMSNFMAARKHGYKNPLHIVKRWDVVQILLNYNANPLIKDQDGMNALHHAVLRGDKHSAVVMMRRSEEEEDIEGLVEDRDRKGRTALDLANDEDGKEGEKREWGRILRREVRWVHELEGGGDGR